MDREQEFEGHMKFFYDYLRNQGIAPREIEVCLDAIILSTTFDFVPATIDELKQCQAFVAYSCGIGKRKDGKPETIPSRKIQYSPEIYTLGATNIGLAKVICDYHSKGIKLPVFAQWEIGVALEEIGFLGELHVVKPRDGEYFSTEEVVKQLLETGLERMDRVAIVASRDHMRRARATTRYEAERKRGYDFKSALMTDTKGVPIEEPESLHEWRRDSYSMMRNEIGSRIHNSISLFGPGIPAKYFLD